MGEKIGEYYYEVTVDNKLALGGIGKTNAAMGNMEAVGTKALGLLKAGWIALAAGIGIALQKSLEFAKKAVEDLKSEGVLDNALKKIGMRYKDIADKVSELSQKNAIDDDDIKQLYSYGIAMGVPAAKLSEFVQTSIDFSAQTGKELPMSMRMVANEVKKGGDSFERLKRAVEGAGQAAGDLDVFKKLDIAWDEFGEESGKAFLRGWKPVIEYIIDLLNKITEKIKEANAKANEKRIKEIPEQIKQLEEYNKKTRELMKDPSLGEFQKRYYQEELAANTEYIAKLNKELTNLKGTGKSGAAGLMEFGDATKTTKEKIDAINGVLDDLATKLNGIGNPDTANAISQMLSLVNDLKTLLENMPSGGEAAAMSAGTALGMAGLLLSLINAIGNVVSNIVLQIQLWGSGYDSIVEKTEEINHQMKDLEEEQSRLNDAAEYYLALLNQQKAIKNDSAEDIDAEKKSTEDVIEQKKAQIKANEDYIASTKATYGADLEAAKGNLNTQLDGMSKVKKYWDDQIDFYKNNPVGTTLNILSFGNALATAEQNSKIAQANIDNMNARIAAIQKAIDLATTDVNLQTDLINLNQDLVDLEQEKADLINEQLEAQRDITRELLKREKDLGYIDPENLPQIAAIAKSLRAQGWDSASIAEELSNLDVSNVDNRTVNNVNSVRIANYTNKQTSSLNGVMSESMGG